MDESQDSLGSSVISDRIDDNLLEPLSEVSFSEREKTYDAMSAKKDKSVASNTAINDKDLDSSLPDARAKMLHLQRIQRGGDSSNDTVNSSVSKKRSKSHSEKGDGGDNEKEETVSFSLETIIRRGLNEQKLNTNFNNSFKFGKPDDNISLRVNPSANLFYEHSNTSYSDSTSDSYESGEKTVAASKDVASDAEELNESEKNVDESRNADGGAHGAAPAPSKRKPGRPRLTDQQKLDRAAEKAAKKTQRESILHANNQGADATPVDELMAMGHSLFSEYAPKKRGRRKKIEYTNFAGANESAELHSDQSKVDDALMIDNSAPNAEFPPKKKRGRKPKSWYLLNESNAHTDKSLNAEQTTASTTLPLVAEKKKRGRKPKYLENYYVKLDDNDQMFEGSQPEQHTAENGLNQQSSSEPVKKKRGRKPKSFYLQQEAERLNETAPAALQDHAINEDITVRNDISPQIPPAKREVRFSSVSALDLEAMRRKRGRKPRIYYEQLALQQQQQQSSHNEIGGQSYLSDQSPISTNNSLNDNYSTPLNDSQSDATPPQKKRGRKPKSYYLELQRQQALGNQSTPLAQSGIKLESSRSNHKNMENGHQPGIDPQSSYGVTFLPTKRIPKPTLKQYDHNPNIYLKRLPVQQKAFRQTSGEIPGVGLTIKKKRGRKPKNYQPCIVNVVRSPQHNNAQQPSNEAHYDRDQSTSVTQNSGVHAESYNKALHDRNKVLMDLLEQRGDEIRTLKQRMSNLINDKIEIKENGTSFSWTGAELCKAFSLQRQKSIPLFNYMRDKFSIPLPSQDDVSKFVRNIQLVRGLQSTMLQILENDGYLYTDYEKVTVLQISYVKTAELFEYDESQDYIWGPHKFLTLIVARGLYSDWSQLVYLNFDVRVSKQNLNCVIEALHKINFPVTACACSFEEGKLDLWSELEVSYGKNSFRHPITAEQVYAFYYAADLLLATNKHFIDGHLTLDGQPINKTAVLQAIQRNYRKIAIEKGLLEWADADCNNVNAIQTFFSQYTVNLLRISSPDDRATKNTVEFINMIKSFADMMSRKKIVETEVDTINFDTYLDFQNKKLDKVHARMFKLQCTNQMDLSAKRFREAIMMSIVSLKMLRKSVMAKYKYPTFSTVAITNEFLKEKVSEIMAKNNFERLLPPILVFRILKDIFLGENCSIKLEPTVKFFHSGAVTAAEVNGRNESYYVMLLIQWLCDKYMNKYPNTIDPRDLKRKLKKFEEAFCSIQNPNFRICEGAVTKITKKLMANASGAPMDDVIRSFVVQRHLLRIKYFNENRITRIPMPVQMTITLEE